VDKIHNAAMKRQMHFLTSGTITCMILTYYYGFYLLLL